MSRKSLRFLVPVVLGLILISQFNNCDNFSTTTPIDTTLTSQCVGSSCDSQISDDLQIVLNNAAVYGVNSTVQAFDIGGWCDDAGYPNNKIVWQLSYNNFVVFSSRSLALTSQPTCIYGRFILRIDLGATRVGLMNPLSGNTRTSYELDIEVVGIDSRGVEYHNTMNARKRMILNPILP